MLPYFAGAAALVFAGYHTMGPTSQLYGRTFTGESPGSKRLALTFDDGPSDPHTLHLLDVLAKHKALATFFMIGAHVAQRSRIARAVAESGHEIGNHTHMHPLLTLKSRKMVRAEAQACEAALWDATGRRSRLFRPPYGARRPGVLREIRELGYEAVMWRVAGYDWRTQSDAEIERNVRSRIRGGEVILLHDGSPENGADRSGTVQATELLLSGLSAQGYRFVTVSEMLGSRLGANATSAEPIANALRPRAEFH